MAAPGPEAPRLRGRISWFDTIPAWIVAGAVALTVVFAMGAPRPPAAAAPSTPNPSAAALADRITTDGLGSSLDALAKTATDNGGTRRTGGAGDAASVAFIEDTLRKAGYDVREDPFDTAVFTDGSSDEVSITGAGAPTFLAGRDFAPLMFSPAGTVEGPVVALAWDPTARAADGPGCNAADFADFPAGAIVLARPANCLRRKVVLNAQAAGAAAVIAGVPWTNPGEIRRSTLIDPGGLTIPAMAADNLVGNALAALQPGQRVRIVTSGSSETRTLRNVLADLPGADPSRVVIVGAHVDTSMDGPGIDDDGTGVATILALAQALAGTTPPVTIRFAFWAAEESGLHGSTHYVEGLGSGGGPKVVAYLNADMLGSPNGYRGVYDDAQAAPGSGAIRDLFEADLTAAGLAWKTEDLFGSADHAPFEQAGIPTGGLFSGAAEIMSPADADTFGRQANEYADPCYHLACDGRSNVDAALFLQLARSFARVTLEVAANPPG
ncbi:MAG TPA: M20/M25/M40 family metallo-hydrolase [Candidatus Limnocylindrales bacterium]